MKLAASMIMSDLSRSSFEVGKPQAANVSFYGILRCEKKFHWIQSFSGENCRSKRSPVNRACIDIQTVWALVRDAVLDRCVTVDNETAEVLGAWGVPMAVTRPP